MRVFFAIRALSQKVMGKEESELPLTPPTNTYKVGDTLDMSEWFILLCNFSPKFIFGMFNKSLLQTTVVQMLTYLQYSSVELCCRLPLGISTYLYGLSCLTVTLTIHGQE